MDKELAKHILERFYNGETTADEEHRLRNYLLNENDDSEFEPDRKLFKAMMDLESQCDMSDAIGDRLDSLIDRLERQESANRKRKVRPLSICIATLSVAAVLCIVIMLFSGKNDDLELRTGLQVAPIASSSIATDTSSRAQEKIVNAEIVAESKPEIKLNKHTRKSLTKKRVDEILNTEKKHLAKAESAESVDDKVEKQMQKAFDKLQNVESKIAKIDEKLAKANQYI